MTRRRLDAELVRRKLARSRDHAGELIVERTVKVNGLVITKPASQVEESASITVKLKTEDTYVSRGAHKLIGALDSFHIDVTDLVVLDAGASTGGFSEVLLRRGVAKIFAVDVGYGQLAWKVSQDPKVVVMDRTNIRHTVPEDLGELVDLIVADLSFISLHTVLPALVGVLKPEGSMLLMVKPQFEVGKDLLGSGGVVDSPELRVDSVARVAQYAYELGLGTKGVVASPLPGPSGNVEYFLWLHRQGDAPQLEAIELAVKEGPA